MDRLEVAGAAGAIWFVLLHGIAPALLAGAVGRALAPMFGLLGWMALLVFGLIAVASYVRASR